MGGGGGGISSDGWSIYQQVHIFDTAKMHHFLTGLRFGIIPRKSLLPSYTHFFFSTKCFSYTLTPGNHVTIMGRDERKHNKLSHWHWFSGREKEEKNLPMICCCSVTQLCPTVQPYGLQHARLPCPSLSPKVCSNSCPMNWRCHPTISSSVLPFSSCFQSFPASVFFPVSRLFTSGGQHTGTSALVLPMNIQDWFPLG